MAVLAGADLLPFFLASLQLPGVDTFQAMELVFQVSTVEAIHATSLSPEQYIHDSSPANFLLGGKEAERFPSGGIPVKPP